MSAEYTIFDWWTREKRLRVQGSGFKVRGLSILDWGMRKVEKKEGEKETA
jgi:hypothetical protein